MGSPNHSRGNAVQRQRVRNSDIRRQALAEAKRAFDIQSAQYADPRALSQLAQEISEGDRALENTILHMWGVR